MVSLNSTYLIDLLDGEEGAVRRAQLLDREGEPRFVTAPAAAEVLLGGNRRGGRYLERTQAVVDGLALLPFDREAYREAARLGAWLSARGTPDGSADLFIAAISKRHGEAVLTRDPAFHRIPGVIVDSY